ncbi:hypothetical protein MKW92_031896 [Papaver armeniacum]|nr:hypothetical protein MKW92_031896 [Papaver armeniacum]
MSKKALLLVSFLFCCHFVIPSFCHEHEQPETFIVYVSKSEKPSIFSSHHDWYTSTLQSLPPSSDNFNNRPSREIIYTYDHAIHGFSASLTPSQAFHLRSYPGINSVSRERTHQFYTTYTPRFLGLITDYFGILHESYHGVDVIIGVLDSGIWPERQSFNDSGLPPVPKRWKGICEVGPDFPETSCNRKIIGARAFYKGIEAKVGYKIDANGTESRSPRDTNGHGTHCASTAAGSIVENAGFHKYAVGEAKGIANGARIASYKIGWGSFGCVDSDVLAGMDQAVADGVDVMSLSFGTDIDQYYQNSIAIAAFSAVEKGILVTCAAGNAGPNPKTASNLAPWILTVGASTTDREFLADVILGDGRVFPGVSLYPGEAILSRTYSEIIYVDGDRDAYSKYCLKGSLDSNEVAGKIVVCVSGEISGADKGKIVEAGGGVGMIVIGTNERLEGLTSESYTIPAAEVSNISGYKIIEYINSNNHSNDEKPTATIKFRGTVFSSSTLSGPNVASFSSRGPNHITQEIIKPDVIAPGVNILAAWPGFAGANEFNILSGTSTACSHVSGLAALLRNVYPSWSPSAIKSAILTSASNIDYSSVYITDLGTGKFSTPFSHGSGQVDPNEALNPGLVYDIKSSDYEAFLCSIGYDAKQLSVFVKDRKVDCEAIGLSTPGELNYPSFSVVFKPGKTNIVKYKRVVTNVGSSANAVYIVWIRVTTPSVNISVSPTMLVFSENKTSLPYEITFESTLTGSYTAKEEFGLIEWHDGIHTVRSPIAFSWAITTSSS